MPVRIKRLPLALKAVTHNILIASFTLGASPTFTKAFKTQFIADTQDSCKHHCHSYRAHVSFKVSNPLPFPAPSFPVTSSLPPASCDILFLCTLSLWLASMTPLSLSFYLPLPYIPILPLQNFQYFHKHLHNSISVLQSDHHRPSLPFLVFVRTSFH